MAAFLRHLCGMMRAHLPARPTMLTGLSPEFGTPRIEGVISRLGVRPAALIHEIAEAPEAGLAAYAADWFPWWDEALTARAWRNLGLGLMWVELRWAPPADEIERRLYALALLALDRAAALDPELELPAREMAEVRALLDPAVDPRRPPAPEGIGYRRGPLRVDVGDGWSLEAPGYFWRHVVDGGFSLAFAHGPRLILASTLSFELRPGATLDESAEPPGPGEFRFEVEGLTGRAELVRGEGAAGAPRAKLRATIVGPQGRALVSVGFENHENQADLAWAKAVLESIRYEPPGA
jgi:hypothetical protein